jgi:hypothetical protein
MTLQDLTAAGVRMSVPHLTLDRAPVARELALLRREMLRNRCAPRDGVLVCSIPIDFEYEVKCMPMPEVFWPVQMYGHGAYEARLENEIGQIYGWRIVVRAS